MPRDELLTAPLGQLPLGLLDFFSVKSMGQYPQRMGDQVLPMMDLFRWYADATADTGTAILALVPDTSFVFGSISSTAWLAGTGAFDFARGDTVTVVPQNELWIVLEATTDCSFTDAGGSGDVVLSASQSNNNSGTNFIVTDGPLIGFTSGVAGITRAASHCATRPYFLQPGMELRTRIQGILDGAGTVNIRHSVRIRRLLR